MKGDFLDANEEAGGSNSKYVIHMISIGCNNSDNSRNSVHNTTPIPPIRYSIRNLSSCFDKCLRYMDVSLINVSVLSQQVVV